jgi:hypothetical protein
MLSPCGVFLWQLFCGMRAMPKRCAYCGGRFGLVRQHWYQTQFCSKRCRDKFLAKVGEQRKSVRRWLGFSRAG